MGGGQGSPRDLMNLHTKLALLSACNLLLLCVRTKREASDYHASAYFVSFSALLLLLFVDFLGV